MLIPHNSSEVTWRVESNAERSKWSRQWGYLKRYRRRVGKTAHYSGGQIRFCSVLFGSARVAVWMTPKASGQSLHDTSCINVYLTENETRLIPHDSSEVTWRVESNAERSKWSRQWGYLKRYRRRVGKTAHYSGGQIRFCSAQLGLQCEWPLRRLANPCTTRHVLMSISQRTRRGECDPTNHAHFSRQQRSDVTRRERRGAILMY